MRNLLIVVTLVIVGLTSCGPKNQYKIVGSITGIDSGLVYLQKRDAGEWNVIDSAGLVSGKFNLQGTIESPELWYLTVKDAKVYVPLFVESSVIKVHILADSLEGTSITGSFTHDVYQDYQKQMEPIDEEMNAIYKEYRKARETGDDAAIAKADSMYIIVEAKQKEQILA
ncbi:MAG: DUF4369 domain-containing protein, partial [Bacteroidota bacterium]